MDFWKGDKAFENEFRFVVVEVIKLFNYSKKNEEESEVLLRDFI